MFFVKKAQKQFPFWQSAPYQKGSALGELFLYGKDRQNWCPFAKGHQNSAPKGTVLVPSIFLSVGIHRLINLFTVWNGFPYKMDQ